MKVVIEYTVSNDEIDALKAIQNYFRDKSPAFIPMDKVISDCDLPPDLIASLIARGFIQSDHIEWESGPEYTAICLTVLADKIISALNYCND